MTILAVFLVMICLSSVSAVEESQLNSTIETVNEISQDENIVIKEINENADDAVSKGEASVVGVSNEKNGGNLLKATDDIQLKSSTEFELRDKNSESVGTVSNPIEVAAGKTVTVQYSAVSSSYDSFYLKMSENNNDVDNYGSNVASGFSGSEAWKDVYEFTTTSEDIDKTYAFKLYSYYSSNKAYLYYKVVQGTADTTTNINVEKDPTDNTKVTITPAVKSGETTITTSDSVEIYINGEKYGNNIAAGGSVVYINSEENTYSVYAHYIGDSTYSESNSSVSIFTLGSTELPVNLTISLNTAGIAPEGSIVVTPLLKDENGNTISGTVDIYEVGCDIPVLTGVSSSGATYTPDSTHTAGNTYQLYAVFSNDGTYAKSTSSKVSYKVKQKFDIVLTVDGETTFDAIAGSYSSSATHYIFYANCGGLSPILNVYDEFDGGSTLVYEGNVHGDSQEIDMWFSTSEVGSHKVYVEFLEDADYLYSKSNDVTFNVYQSRSSYNGKFNFNTSYAVEGDKVLISPTILDYSTYNQIDVGTFEIYSDTSRTDKIATFNVGESYEYTLPLLSTSSSSASLTLYGKYIGDKSGDYIYTDSTFSESITVMKKNNLQLTADGKTGTIEVNQGDKITLHADIDYWNYRSGYDSNYNTVYYSDISIFVDGVETDSFEVVREASGYSYVYNLQDYEMDITQEHIIHAYYAGYNSYSANYASATSNELTIKVKSPTVATTTALTANTTAPKYNEKIIITPSVNDGSVVTGDITYYIGDNNISEAMSIAVPFEYSINTVTPFTIVGKFTGDGYESSEGSVTINPTKADNNIVVTATTVDYPSKVNIKVTADVEGTYTVSIGDKSVDVVANSAEGVDYQLAASDSEYVATVAGWTNDYYEASVTPATFRVNKGTNNIAVIVDENNYLPGDVTVKVTAGVDGDYTVSIGENSVVIPVSGGEGTNTIALAAGENYQATTTFSDNENYTVTIAPATFNVLKSDVELKIIINAIPAGDAVTGTVISNVAGTYSVKIADKDPFDVTVEGTSKEFTTDIVLPIGEDYLAQVSISNNPNYNDYTNQTEFDVIANAVDFKAGSSKSEYVYGEEVILTYELPNGADGEITFTYSSGSTGEAGKITVPTQTQLSLGILDAKEYSIQAAYDGGSLYQASTKTINFKISPKVNDVPVDIANVEYGQPVKVDLSNAVEGIYTVTINGNPVKVTVDSTGSGTNTTPLDLAVGENYLASVSLDNDNYITTGSDSFDVTPATNAIAVTVAPSEVTYGSEITVKVEASVSGKYTVVIDNNPVEVTVGDSLSGETTISLDLAVSENTYQTATSWENANYTASISEASFKVIAATNTVKITVDSPVDYGDDVTVTVEATVADTYTVTIGGKTVNVKVEDASKKVTTSLDLAASTTAYVATTSWENSNYTLDLTECSLIVNPKTNKVTVEAGDTTLPKEVTVNVTADLAGTYRIYFNETAYVDVTVETGNVKATATKKLDVGEYTTRVEFTNANYTNDVTNAEFKVNPELTGSLELRESNNLENDSQVTIKFTDSAKVSLVYKLTKPDAAINSEEITFYYNGSPVNLAITVSEGSYVGFTTFDVSDEGTMNLKLVYVANLKDGSTFTRESNELQLTFEKEVIPSELKIRDNTYQSNSSITLEGDENITVIIDYYLVKPDGYVMTEDLRINIGDEGYIYVSDPTANSWISKEYTFNKTGDYTVKAVYSAKIGISMQEATLTSEEIVYHITINEKVKYNISIESKEVVYGNEANLTVTGSDGEYTVTVNGKPYDVTVFEGTGYAIIDVLEGNKTYDVSIVSKTNSSLFNASTLKVNPRSPDLTVSATNTNPVYGEAITIGTGKIASATGDVKFYEGDKEIDVVNVILSGGSHIITAKYAADGNFTDDEAEITINVAKATNALTLEVTNETYPDNVTITLTATLPGDYQVVIGTTPYTITVGDNNIGIKSIKLNPSSQYNATVDFKDNGNYSANSASYIFHVDGSTPGLNVTPDKTSIDIGDAVEFTTSVEKTDATGKVTYKSDDGWETTANIGEKVSYTPTTTGSHSVEVTYDDGIYDPQTVTATVAVNKKNNNVKVEVPNVELPGNVIAYVTANVSGTYRIYFDDTNYVDVNVIANEKTASSEYELAAGNYTTSVEFANDNYTNIITNADFEVVKTDSEFKLDLNVTEYVYTDEVIIRFTLPSDANGKITVRYANNGTVAAEKELKNGLLTASLNGRNLVKATDKEYEISLGVLPAGEYDFIVEYSGDENYKNTSETVKVTVSGKNETTLIIRDANYPNNETIKVVLESGEKFNALIEYFVNKPADVFYPQLIIYINGQRFASISETDGLTYDKYTNIGGYVAINETGVYTIQAEYKSQAMLGIPEIDVYSNTYTYDVTVKDNIQTVTVEVSSVKYPEKVNVTVKSNIDDNFTVDINGTIVNVTVVGGTGSQLVGLPAGNYMAIATSKTNSSVTNNTEFKVFEEDIVNVVSLNVTGSAYPSEAIVNVNATIDGTYTVDVNSTTVDVKVLSGKGSATVKLDVGDYVAKLDNLTYAFTVSKGKNTVKVDVSDVKLPSQVTVKVTADVDDTYTVDINGTKVEVSVVSGEGSKSVNLNTGNYYANVSWSNNNYETELINDTFTVNETDSSSSLIIRDANYPNNATIAIVETGNASIILEYYVEKPEGNLIVDSLEILVNGQHFTTIDYPTSKSFTDLGGAIVVNETQDLVFTAKYTAWVFLGEQYEATSNAITYHITLLNETEQSVSVEVKDVIYPEKANVTVRSNVDDNFNVDINGTTVEIEVINGTGSKLVELPVGNYTAVATSKTNSSITNSTDFKVFDEDVVNVVGLNVTGAKYPDEAVVNVTATIDGTYTVDINGTKVDVNVVSGKGSATVKLDAGEYVAKLDNLTYAFTVSKGKNSVKVDVSDVKLPSQVTVKVTADVDDTYTVDINGTKVDVSVVSGEGSKLVSLNAGNYYANVTWSDKNYETELINDTFTVNESSSTTVNVSVRDGNYPTNETIKIVLESGEKFNALVEYFVNKPDEAFYPQLIIYVNGQRFASISEADGLTYDNYANIGGYIAINETGVYTIQAEYKSQAMLGIPEIDVYSNTYTYEVTVKENIQSVTVEVPSVKYPQKANVTVKSNIDDNFTVDINGTTVEIEVINGTGSRLVELPVGNYSAVATSKTNSSVTNSTKFIIFDENVENVIAMNVTGAKYPSEAIVNVEATFDGTYTVDINGTKVDVNVVSGKGSKSVKLDVGEYVAKLDNLTYAFVVSKGKNNVKVEVNDVKLPSQVTVKVTADVDGTYAVDINGTKVDVNVVSGEGSKLVSLSVGSYYANISWSDSNYDVELINDTFTVNESDSSSSLIIRDANLPNNATITIVENGNASIVIEYYLEKPEGNLLADSLEILVNGQHFTTIDNPVNKVFTNIGGAIVVNETQDLVFTAKYAAWVFLGEQYEATSNSIVYHITISNETEQIVSVEVKDVIYPEKTNVTVKSNVDDNFTVDINGTTFEIEVTNGTASKLIELPIGNYSVDVTSKTNSSISDSTTFKVLEHKEESRNITIDVHDNDANVIVDIPDASGNVYVIVDGNETAVPLVDGKVNYEIKDMQAGNHSIVVIYEGDSTHSPMHSSSSFTIDEKPAPEPEKPVINIISPKDMKIGETSSINVSIPDATGNVSIIIDGTESIVPLIDGSVSLPVDGLSSGNHSVVVVYMGDDTHESAIATSSFVVDKQTSDVNVTVGDIKIGEDSKITVSIPNATGNVSIIIDGVETSVPLDENGDVNLTVPSLAADSHSIVVVYPGDDTHAPAVISKQINATAHVSEFTDIVVSGDGLITAVIVDDSGSPIANADITYTVNGKEFKTSSDVKGIVLINASSNSVVNIKYEGSDILLPANTTIELKDLAPLRLATSIIASEYTTYAVDFDAGERGHYFNVRLVDENGKALANKPVKIGFNGHVYNKTTNSSGWAQLQINLKQAGRYTFAIAFLGDSDYNASFTVQNINVNLKKTSISAGAKSFKASAKTKSYTVSLKTDVGSSIDGKVYLKAGKKITMKINGKTYTAKTNANGKVTFKISLSKKGKYTASLRFAGDKMYASSSIKTKITIK